MGCKRNRMKKGAFIAAVMLSVALMGCQKAEEKEEIEVPVEEMDTATLDTKEEDAAEDNIVAEEEETPEALAEGAKEDEEDAAGVEATAEVKTPPEGWEFKLASEDWGLSYGESGAQPVGNASAEDLAWYDAYFIGDDSEKVLYLTFDCGYENGNTEKILDALKKHNAQGTFFVVGNFLETAPEIVKRMQTEGHLVGNHTYHHPDMSKISDLSSFQKEMDDVANLYREITGEEMAKLYRPPQGKFNKENLKMAKELGYHTFFWSLAYVDWYQDKQPSAEEAYGKLLPRIHPGAIVLLHSTSKTNGEIMDELLTKWEELGYTFGSLEEFLEK